MERLPSRHLKRWRAFTLIELLVVIAIIAILASLLLPTVSRAKSAVRSAKAKAMSGSSELGRYLAA